MQNNTMITSDFLESRKTFSVILKRTVSPLLI